MILAWDCPFNKSGSLSEQRRNKVYEHDKYIIFSQLDL